MCGHDDNDESHNPLTGTSNPSQTATVPIERACMRSLRHVSQQKLHIVSVSALFLLILEPTVTMTGDESRGRKREQKFIVFH